MEYDNLTDFLTDEQCKWLAEHTCCICGETKPDEILAEYPEEDGFICKNCALNFQHGGQFPIIKS